MAQLSNVPASIVDKLIESHDRQIAELTAIIKNLTSPGKALEPEWQEHPWKSEDDEDAEYMAERERLAAQTLAELGFTSEDIRVE